MNSVRGRHCKRQKYLKNAKPESIEVCFKRKCSIAFFKVTLLFMIFHKLLVPRQPKISWAKKKLKIAMKCPLIIIELDKNVGLLLFFSVHKGHKPH